MSKEFKPRFQVEEAESKQLAALQKEISQAKERAEIYFFAMCHARGVKPSEYQYDHRSKTLRPITKGE